MQKRSAIVLQPLHCHASAASGPAQGAHADVDSILKTEISRVARKEVRAEMKTLRKASVAHRASIAELRRQEDALEKELRRVWKVTAPLATIPTRAMKQQQARTPVQGSLMATRRTKLGLSHCARLFSNSHLSAIFAASRIPFWVLIREIK